MGFKWNRNYSLSEFFLYNSFRNQFKDTSFAMNNGLTSNYIFHEILQKNDKISLRIVCKSISGAVVQVEELKKPGGLLLNQTITSRLLV